MTIKKGNKVKILTGKDKSKEGEIIEIDRTNFRAKVKGLNMIKKHVKTTKEKKGGIFDKENYINLSNLSIISEEKKTIKKDKKVVAKKWYQDLKSYTIMRLNLI